MQVIATQFAIARSRDLISFNNDLQLDIITSLE